MSKNRSIENCLFCKIASGKIKTEILYKNDSVLAFRDINPQAPVHILVIPRIHFESVKEINYEHSHIMSDMVNLANEMAKSEGIKDTGFRWVINTGDDGGQTIPHLHMHILAGRRLKWPPG